jgi:Sulfotransferase domain
MSLRVVGAGLGRTGTNSLKVALERLLGGTCHHMYEVAMHAEEMPVWQAAAEGTMPDWHSFLGGYSASCDWPSAAFWPELSAAYPDALILLSVRDPDSWYRSATDTIFGSLADSFAAPEGENPFADMARALFTNRFTADIGNAEATKQLFVEHNERVQREVPAERLLVWEASEGWAPICAALALPVPDEPFPHTNSTEDFLALRRALTTDAE